MDKLTEEPSLISANTGEKITSILSAILSDKTIVLSNRTLSEVTNTARHIESVMIGVRVFLNDEALSSDPRRSLIEDQLFETALPVEPKTSSNSTYTCRYWDDVEQKWQNDTLTSTTFKQEIVT